MRIATTAAIALGLLAAPVTAAFATDDTSLHSPEVRETTAEIQGQTIERSTSDTDDRSAAVSVHGSADEGGAVSAKADTALEAATPEDTAEGKAVKAVVGAPPATR